MKIFLVVSRTFYKEVHNVKTRLEELGHEVIVPILYGNLIADEVAHAAGAEKYAEFRRKVIAAGDRAISDSDAVLCLNFDKGGTANYISSDMFSELLQAFERKKKIFLWSYIPDGVLRDSILAWNPTVIKRKISTIGIAENFKPKPADKKPTPKPAKPVKEAKPKPAKEVKPTAKPKSEKPKPAPKPTAKPIKETKTKSAPKPTKPADKKPAPVKKVKK
jgi:hypothetical protein